MAVHRLIIKNGGKEALLPVNGEQAALPPGNRKWGGGFAAG